MTIERADALKCGMFSHEGVQCKFLRLMRSLEDCSSLFFSAPHNKALVCSKALVRVAGSCGGFQFTAPSF